MISSAKLGDGEIKEVNSYSPTNVLDSNSPSLDKVKGIWDKIQVYLSKSNPDPTSFYQYLKSNNALRVNPTKSAVDKVATRQKNFVNEVIANTNLSGNSTWAKQLTQVEKYNFSSLDELSSLVSNLSLERACALRLDKYIELILIDKPFSEDSCEEFKKAFLEIKDKNFQKKLVLNSLTKPQLLPYLDYLKENCFSTFYSLLKNEIARFSREEHYLPKDLRVQKLFSKVCVPSFLQGISLGFRDLKAHQDVEWIKKRISHLPASLKASLKELGAIGKNNQIREGLTSFETKQTFISALRFLGREFESYEGASWEMELPAKLGKRTELFRSAALDVLDLGIELKQNVAFIEQCGFKRELEFIYLSEVLKLAAEMKIPLSEEEKHDVHLSQDLRLVGNLVSSLPQNEIEAALKKRVKFLYEELFSKEAPASATTYELFLFFKKKWSSLYSSLKSKIADPAYLALAEKAYTMLDVKLLRSIEKDLSGYLIPVHETEELTPSAESYLSLEKKLLNSGKKAISHFMNACLEKDSFSYDSPDDALNGFQDFLKSSIHIKNFFISKGVLKQDGSFFPLDKKSNLRNIQSYLHMFYLLISHAGKAQGKKIEISGDWDYINIEKACQDLGAIDFDLIERELNVDTSASPYNALSPENTPKIYSLFRFLKIIHKNSWDFERNFSGKYVALRWLVQMLKDNTRALFPVIEAEEREQKLEEMLESSDVNGMETVLQEIYSKVIEIISSQPSKTYTLKGGITLSSHLGSIALDSFENESWEWAQHSSFRHSLSLAKEFQKETLTPYEKMILVQDLLNSFYAQCSNEITQNNMSPFYFDLLELAVSSFDTKACTWLFQTIAYERYLKKLVHLSIYDLPDLRNSNWTIDNIIKKTKIMLGASDLSPAIRSELFHSLDSFPVELQELPSKVNEETLAIQIESYLSQESTSESSFLNYLRSKGFSSKTIEKSDLKRFYQIFREFVQIKIQEVELSNSSWHKGLILELEKCQLEEFSNLDFIDKVLSSKNVKKAVEISFKGELVYYIQRIISEKLVSLEFFQENFKAVASKDSQITILKALLLHKRSSFYVKSLIRKGDSSIKQIAYDALGSLLEDHSLITTSVFNALFNGFVDISKESDFLIDVHSSAADLFSLGSLLNSDEKRLLLRDFFKRNEFLGPPGFIEFDSWPKMNNRVQKCLCLLANLNKVSTDNLDTLTLNIEITKRAYFTFLLSLPKDSTLRNALSSLYKGFKSNEISLERMMSDAQVLLDANCENVNPNALKEYLKKATEINRENKDTLFPWKPLVKQDSALAMQISSIGLNRQTKSTLLQQYLDGQDFLEEVKDRCFKKKEELESHYEGMSDLKQKMDLASRLYSLDVKLNSVKLPDGADLLAEAVDEIIQMKVELSKVNKEVATNSLLDIWGEEVKTYLEWTRTKPTPPEIVKTVSSSSLYEQYADMKYVKKLIFQILKVEIADLNFPSLYSTILTLTHYFGNHEFSDWLTKKVLYAKYEGKLKDLTKLDEDLFVLSQSVKGLQVNEKIEKTKNLLSQKEGEIYKELFQGLEELPWIEYLTKR